MIRFILLFLFGISCWVTSYPQQPTTPTTPPTNGELKEDKRSPIRPNSLVEEVVMYRYSNGMLEFILPHSIHSGTVIITSGSFGEIFYIASDENIINWSPQTEIYTIEFISEDGRHFSGTLTLN